MYLIDSDVFIRAKNGHYGFDIVPAFWDWLIQTHDAGKVFTVDACRNEVLDGGDELATWMAARPATFAIKPSGNDQAAFTELSQWANESSQYNQGAKAQFLGAGDYYLVAQARSLGYSVVTHEEPAPQSKTRIKIPDACNAVNVRAIQPWEMLRREGARFRL